MYIKLVALLFALINWCSWAMDPFMEHTIIHHKAGYSNIYSYVTGSFVSLKDENITVENKSFLNSCISDIRKVCPTLLDIILKELLDSSYKNINFVFSDENVDGTSFVQPNKKMHEERIEIVVNLSKARLMDGHLFSMVPTLNDVASLADERVSMIYETASPFWLTIAHELIHLKHWLDEKAGRTVSHFDVALHKDIKLLSYSAAKGGTIDLVLSEFNKCCNPYKLLALVDNLNLSFKKPVENDAISGMIKFFVPFSGKNEEELHPEFLKKDKKQVFLDILTRLEIRFAWAREAFIQLRASLETGNIEEGALTVTKRCLFDQIIGADKCRVGIDPYAEHLVKLFPEVFLSIRTGMNSMWPELEERRTVFGPDIDDISEASIRMRAELPLRYLYQDRVEYFVESIRVFDETISQYLKTPRAESIRYNTFPTTMSLMPLATLFKIHQFGLKNIFDDCGNLELIAAIFGYRRSANFLKIFE